MTTPPAVLDAGFAALPDHVTDANEISVTDLDRAFRAMLREALEQCGVRVKSPNDLRTALLALAGDDQ